MASGTAALASRIRTKRGMRDRKAEACCEGEQYRSNRSSASDSPALTSLTSARSFGSTSHGAPMPTIRDLVGMIRQREGVEAAIVLGRDGLLIDGQSIGSLDV